MRGATCFSGIGAPEIAMPDVDWIWHAEIEKFPAAVMAERHPENTNLGDVLAPDFIDRAKAMGPLDIMVGGPPCQAFSIAGLRGSMSDPRGNLSLRWVQILHAIRPSIAVTENVPGWLNTPDNAFGCFLAGIVGADTPLVSRAERGRWPNHGMVAGPLARAAWRVLDAQHVRTREFPWAVPQRRRRVFVVVDLGAGIVDPAAVLFDRESLLGNPAPSRETGEGIAPTLAARTRGGGGLGTDFDLDGGLTPVCADGWPASVAPTLTADFASKQGQNNQRAFGGAGLFVPAGVAHTPRAEGFDASEDGTGRGTPIVPVQTYIAFSAKDHGGDAQNEVSPKRRAGGHSASHANAGVMPAVAFPAEMSSTQCASTEELSPALSVKHTTAVAADWQVRRLTPTECERLQGFPDGHTAIPWRGKPAEACPDGPRYKALGNSMACNVLGWIGERIKGVANA